MSVGLGRKGISIHNGVFMHVLFSKKMKTEIKTICMARGIEMSQFIRESVAKNNQNYKYLIRNIH